VLYKITVQLGTQVLSFPFNRRVVSTPFMRLVARMFLHLVGVSLAQSFNLVSNVWHVEIMMKSGIGNVLRCVDNDSEISILKCL